jgi:hypothetical protein
MNALFKKLNFKNHKEIVVMNPPDSFNKEIEEMSSETSFLFDINQAKEIHFAIVFVKKKSETEESIALLSKKLAGDAVVWFCYPKGTSKNYTCDFNRDTGWSALEEYGLEPVRMVSIDEDWSALRFRKVEYIKNMTRNENMTLTKEGKLKATKDRGQGFNYNYPS